MRQRAARRYPLRKVDLQALLLVNGMRGPIRTTLSVLLLFSNRKGCTLPVYLFFVIYSIYVRQLVYPSAGSRNACSAFGDKRTYQEGDRIVGNVGVHDVLPIVYEAPEPDAARGGITELLREDQRLSELRRQPLHSGRAAQEHNLHQRGEVAGAVGPRAERHASAQHAAQNQTSRPHVDRRRLPMAAEEHLGSAVSPGARAIRVRGARLSRLRTLILSYRTGSFGANLMMKKMMKFAPHGDYQRGIVLRSKVLLRRIDARGLGPSTS